MLLEVLEVVLGVLEVLDATVSLKGLLKAKESERRRMFVIFGDLC